MGFMKKMMGYDDNEIKEPKKNLPSVQKMVILDATNIVPAKKIADYLMKGYPVLINFDGVDLVEANQTLSFVSGVSYALKGEVYRLKNKIILFTDEENLSDGTIKQFVNKSKS